MIKPEAFTQKVEQFIKQSPIGGLSNELQATFRSQISELLAQSSLVSRDEFDAQSAILARTEARLTELERKLSELESAS